MHKLLITDQAGVVINTKHYPVGSIIDGVPRGIAVACVHFKQAKDLSPASVSSREETQKGTALERFTAKLKKLLMDEGKMPDEKASELIKAHTHLVGLGALGGDAALEPTAFALIQTLVHAGGLVAQRPLAAAGGTVAAGGGEMATSLPGALPDGGMAGDRPTPLQEASAKAEDAEIAAAADGTVNKGKGKVSRK